MTSSPARAGRSIGSRSTGPDGTRRDCRSTPSPIRHRQHRPTGCCSAPRRTRPKPAAPWLARLCTPQTRVAVLQNGIDHVARVAPLANGAAVVPVIVYYNGERLAPDHVRLRQGAGQRHRRSPTTKPAAPSRGCSRARRLRVLLSDDFATLLWRKLLINAVANPITALTLQRQAVLRRPDIQQLCHAVLDEAVAVARADGVRACRRRAGAHNGDAVDIFRRTRHLDVFRSPRRTASWRSRR